MSEPSAVTPGPREVLKRYHRARLHLSADELAEAGFTESLRGDYPGISAYFRVGEEVFRTYSTFGRGIEEFHNG